MGRPPQERVDSDQIVRLMAGGTDDVLRGISLIEAAAARNDPAALERRALLEAVGCGRQPSWDNALNSLANAAKLGSKSAQDQLRILARVNRESEDWNAIRSGIKIDEVIRAPQKRSLSEKPWLRVIKDFAAPGECRWLKERASDRLKPATVIAPSGSQAPRAVRTNSAIGFQLYDMDVLVEVIRARISAVTQLPLPLFEASQVLHYTPGQEFRPHHDYFDPQNPGHAEYLKRGQRIATFLIYLNDDYGSGETAFPSANLSFKGKIGDALFIANIERSGRPDPLTLHAGTPPTSGEKWIFSQWIRDKPHAASP